MPRVLHSFEVFFGAGRGLLGGLQGRAGLVGWGGAGCPSLMFRVTKAGLIGWFAGWGGEPIPDVKANKGYLETFLSAICFYSLDLLVFTETRSGFSSPSVCLLNYADCLDGWQSLRLLIFPKTLQIGKVVFMKWVYTNIQWVFFQLSPRFLIKEFP